MRLAQDLGQTELTRDGDYTKHIRYARVINVYDSNNQEQNKLYGSVDLMWLDTSDRVNGHVSFLTPSYSFSYGYGILAMPSVGDIAACFTLPDAPPVILGFLPLGMFESTHADKDNAGSIGYIQKLSSGEVLIKNKAQSEIHLKNDGSIKVSIRDGSKTTPVLNNSSQYTAEDFLNRASCEDINTQIELDLGKKDDVLVGPGKQLIKLSSGSYTNKTYEFEAQKGQLSYTTTPIFGYDICSVKSVELYKEENEKLNLVKRLNSENVELSISYYYIPESDSKHDPERQPCSLETNGSVATITLSSNLIGLLSVGTRVVISLTLRKNAFNFSVNDLGDVFFDCRNFVVRTNNYSSYLGLFSKEEAVLGANSVKVGDPLGGFVQCNSSGVRLSRGINELAENNTVAEAKDVMETVKCYFYIFDELPLFYYDPADEVNPFGIVDIGEYLAMDKPTKLTIRPRGFDSELATSGFTATKARDLLNKYKEQGLPYMPYGEMRSFTK